MKLGDNGGGSASTVLDRDAVEREPARVRRLSVALDHLAEHYDVVVVGSGYGGAIAAARLAAAGKRVCVLERGRELQAGDFPNSLWGGLRQFQWRSRSGRHGRRTGLFDVRVDHDVSLLVGCGLGGTSLINAGVTIRPPAWVFDDERWPAALRGDGGTVLAPYFRRAEEMLGVSAYPEGPGEGADPGSAWPRLPKLDALADVAAAVGGELQRPNLAINFHSGTNRFGVEQSACQLCGDCVSGCNYGAKNSVTMNYLPLAVARGAHVFTETDVQTVLPSPLGGWTVSFASLADGRAGYRTAPSLFVRADIVVLAAGTLGSTEILFRSRAAGLAVSPRLGHAFSSNGDALAVAYEADRPVRGIGLGRTLPTPETAVGPCITGSVLVPGDAGSAASEPDDTAAWSFDRSNGSDRSGRGDLLIQEGAIPSPLRPLMPATLAIAAAGDDGGGPLQFLHRLARRARTGAAAFLPTRRGAASAADRTLTYLLMGDDGGDGRLEPAGDGIGVRWTGAGDHPIFGHGREVLAKASAALGAELIVNPLSTPMLHDSVLSVHPLGGCPMGDDGATGVVDDRGRVFSGDGAEVHDGLLVVDGAVVPRPLTVNPLLTISALAERSSELLVRDLAPVGGPRDSQPEAQAPDGASLARPTTVPGNRPGLSFTERMRGFMGTVADPGPDADADDLVAAAQAGARRGRSDGTAVEFVLTVRIDDLPSLLDDPSRPGRLAGTVVAPLLSPRRLRVVDGHFTLVREDTTHVDTWHMRYVMELASEDGRRFRFDGTKFLHDRAGLDAWSDTTTLHVTITEVTELTELPHRPPTETGAPAGEASAAPAGPAYGAPSDAPDEAATVPLVTAGVMTLGPTDFARQLTTMRVSGVSSRLERLRWLARFDARFLRSLWKVYGGPLDDVGKLPEKLRTSMPFTGSGLRKLRLPAPEPRWCDAHGRWHEGNDLGPDAWLRLVRFEGGRRGPVLLAPGFGMSATSFLIDTVETNLAEHLVAKGYDVWVFDYRAGMDLPSSHTPFTIDDVATQDWPAAVEEVLRVTGAGTVQVVGHCFGSMTLMMALAAGLRDVRSAVCMQVTLHPVPPLLTQIKSSLGIGHLLRAIGMTEVAPLRGTTLGNVALDLALRAVPLSRDERCGKAVCRWINAIYGITHRHEQLNDATHDLLDQLFGAGNLTGIEHGRKIFQRRAVYADDGSNAYLAHPERLRLPLMLLHGARNPLFHPEGSLRTLRWLQAANDPSLYQRVVVPDYGHLDAVIGRNASRDVFPIVSQHLDRFNR